MDTNAFNNPAAVKATITPTPAPKQASSPSGARPSTAGKAATAPAAGRSTNHNPKTAATGVPRQTGWTERQLDGNRSPVMSKPVRKGGLAERQAAPDRSRSAGGSGMEASMAALADQLHPRKRPKSTRK